MSVAPRQTSALAVVSLVMGIASWTVLPFVASDLIRTVILVAFPAITLWLVWLLY